MALNPGDVVMLKSGGPLMTVARKSSEGEGYICSWFETPKGIYSTATIVEAMLEKSTDSPGPLPLSRS